MPEVAILLLAACGTALATGLGAIPVFLLGTRAAALAPLLLGFAAGVMGVAAVAGLLIPAAQEGSAAEVIGGLAVGVGFLALVRWRFTPTPASWAAAARAPAPRPSSFSSSSSTACPRASRSAPPSPRTGPG